MDVDKAMRAAMRRVNAKTDERCDEALRRLGIEPPPAPHPSEGVGYQLGLMAKAWNESMAAFARGIKAGLR